MMKFGKYKSLENSSILVRFHVFFVVMAIVPLILLAYLYLQLKDGGGVEMTTDQLALALLFTVLGIVGGYLSMRFMLKNLIDITQVSTEKIRELLGPSKGASVQKGSDDEIAMLTRTFHEVTYRLEEDVCNLQATKRTLQMVLKQVGQGMASMRDIDTFFDLIVGITTEALSGKAGFLFLLNEDKTAFVVKSAYGLTGKPLTTSMLDIQSSPFAPAVLAKTALIVPRTQYLKKDATEVDVVEYPLICAPLLVHDEVLGVVAVSGRKIEEDFTEDEMALLMTLATQTAVATENSKLNASVDKTYFETLSALAMAVEAKDVYSRGHLDRVAGYAVKLGQYLGLDGEALADLRDAAKIHDIGKIGITDDILTKPGPLDEQEWQMMKRHPEIGESIIKPITSLQTLRDVVRHHHEKLDGTGYPDKLKGDEISLPVRIMTVADIYDALITDRPYRKAMSPERAVSMLREMGEAIDQNVVTALKRCGENIG